MQVRNTHRPCKGCDEAAKLPHITGTRRLVAALEDRLVYVQTGVIEQILDENPGARFYYGLERVHIDKRGETIEYFLVKKRGGDRKVTLRRDEQIIKLPKAPEQFTPYPTEQPPEPEPTKIEGPHLQLRSTRDWVWFTDEYPLDKPVPEYILHFLEEQEEEGRECVYRKLVTGADTYVLVTKV